MQISLNLTRKQVSCLPKSHNSVINYSSGDIEVFIFYITNVWTVSWGKLDISLQKYVGNCWAKFTASMHLCMGIGRECTLAVNFAQQSPEDTKRLFSEPTILSQKSCYIMCKRCLGLNNYLVHINLTKISR